MKKKNVLRDLTTETSLSSVKHFQKHKRHVTVISINVHYNLQLLHLKHSKQYATKLCNKDIATHEYIYIHI